MGEMLGEALTISVGLLLEYTMPLAGGGVVVYFPVKVIS